MPKASNPDEAIVNEHFNFHVEQDGDTTITVTEDDIEVELTLTPKQLGYLAGVLMKNSLAGAVIAAMQG